MAGTITASVVKNDTTSPPQFQNSAGTEIGQLCRAWVNFNGSTAAIRASFNVSSVARNGTGDYTVNFTNALADANYSVSGVASTPGSISGSLQAPAAAGSNQATGSLRVYTVNTSAALFDATYTNVAIFR